MKKKSRPRKKVAPVKKSRAREKKVAPEKKSRAKGKKVFAIKKQEYIPNIMLYVRVYGTNRAPYSRFLPARRVNKEEQESPKGEFSWAANFHGLEGGCTHSGHQACR